MVISVSHMELREFRKFSTSVVYICEWLTKHYVQGFILIYLGGLVIENTVMYWLGMCIILYEGL